MKSVEPPVQRQRLQAELTLNHAVSIDSVTQALGCLTLYGYVAKYTLLLYLCSDLCSC